MSFSFSLVKCIPKFFEFVDSLPVVTVFIIGCAFLYPMAKFLFPHIKGYTTAAAVHFILGFTMSLLLFKSDTLYCLTMAVLTYIGIRFCSVTVSISIATISLIISHIIVSVRPCNWSLDLTGITMVMFQKAVSLSFNLSDGKERKSAKDHKLKRERWDLAAIDEVPSFLVYLGYVFTPYGSFSNPFIEFVMFDKILKRGTLKKEDIVEEDHKFALFRYIGSFFWVIFAQISMSIISLETTYKADWYLKTPLLIKPFIVAILTCAQAARYSPAWWLIESGFYEFGLGYSLSKNSNKDTNSNENKSNENNSNANDSNVNESKKVATFAFDEVSNLSMFITLQSPTADEWMRRWNHTTHLFWKNYLFTRLLNKGYSFTLSNTLVFVCSMAWHGLRFVYLGMLPEAFLLMRADAYWNKKFPQKNSSKFVKFIHNLWTVVAVLNCVSTWYFPSFQDFMYIRKSVCFLPSIVAVLIIIIVKLTPAPRREQENDKKEKTN